MAMTLVLGGDLALQLAVNQQLFPQNNVCNNMLQGCP